MKKIIITALVISTLTLAFFACDSDTTEYTNDISQYSTPETNEPANDTNSNNNNHFEPYEPFTVPSFGIPRSFTGGVTYGYVTQNYVNTHPNSSRFVYNDEGHWMSFAFDVHLRDVMFVHINAVDFSDYDEVQNYEVTTIIHRVGAVNANHPIFIQTIGHFGTMPAQAIGFVLPDGTRMFIPFDQSQMDNSLTLHYWAAFTPR